MYVCAGDTSYCIFVFAAAGKPGSCRNTGVYKEVLRPAGVIADTRELQRQAWRQVADEEGLPFPQSERQLYDLRPERAITEVCALRCALFLGHAVHGYNSASLPCSSVLCVVAAVHRGNFAVCCPPSHLCKVAFTLRPNIISCSRRGCARSAGAAPGAAVDSGMGPCAAAGLARGGGVCGALSRSERAAAGRARVAGRTAARQRPLRPCLLLRSARMLPSCGKVTNAIPLVRLGSCTITRRAYCKPVPTFTGSQGFFSGCKALPVGRQPRLAAGIRGSGT